MGRVAVIGGGAAGMMAALAAAGNGAAVTLYEKNDRVGRKLLATGNGKCNFANRDFSVDYYYGNGRLGADSRRLEGFFRQFSMEDAVAFFKGAGMLVKEKRGYLYPWSEQASTVSDILRLELGRRNVEIRVSAEVSGIGKTRIGKSGIGKTGIGKKGGKGEYGDARFYLEPFEEDGGYHAVIIACGGCAAPKTGSDGSGYVLAKKLGHRVVETVPALVQLRCGDAFFKTVAGVRCEAGLTLYACREGKGGRAKEKDALWERIQEETGELQFTDYGISGIPVFQFSRQAAYLLAEKRNVAVSVDFFPHLGQQEYAGLCAGRLRHREGKNVEEFLLGMANKKVNLLLAKLAGLKPEESAAAIGERKLEKLLWSYRELRVHVSAVNSFEHAQVTAGGVDMAEVSESLSSLKEPGVYFAGEVLDVDGRCGGYNLQWAWTSGYIAGTHAALGRT